MERTTHTGQSAALDDAAAVPADRRRIFDLMRFLRGLPDVEYMQYLIAYHAAPTPARMKPATLICPDAKGRDLPAALDQCARRMSGAFGVELLSLKNRAGALMVLIYQPDLLCTVLRAGEVKTLLAESGYDVPSASVADVLHRLGQKCASRTFPHEIGVFLGYPPGDVRMFMQGGGGKPMSGCWKAWSNHREAEQRSARYHDAKMRAAELIVGGGKSWGNGRRMAKRRVSALWRNVGFD